MGGGRPPSPDRSVHSQSITDPKSSCDSACTMPPHAHALNHCHRATVHVTTLHKPEQVLDEQVHVRVRRGRVRKVQIVHVLGLRLSVDSGSRVRRCHIWNSRSRCRRRRHVVLLDVDNGQFAAGSIGLDIGRQAAITAAGRLRSGHAIVQRMLSVDCAEAVDNFEAILLGVLTLSVTLTSGQIGGGRPTYMIGRIDGFGFGELANVAGNVVLSGDKVKNRLEFR